MANQREKGKSYIASTLITVLIVIMLIVSGPASAVQVSIAGLGTSYTQGDSISFKVNITVNDIDKFVPMSGVSINVTGPSNFNGTFNLNGTQTGGAANIDILSVTPVPGTSGDFGSGFGYGYDFGYGYGYDFGYGSGYGYGYGGGGGTVTYIYNVAIDTTSLPTGSYTVSASLNTGNSAHPSFTSASQTFNLGYPSRSTGTGGGTGGGGVVYPAEPPENLEAVQRMDVTLAANTPTTIPFTNPDMWLQSLIITGANNEIGVAISAQQLKDRSKNVPVPAPGTKYLSIWVGTQRIKEALINFRVPNSWLASEGISNAVMYRWDGSNWQALDTSQVSKDDANTYYQAKTTAFSYFAISGPKAAPTPTPTATATPSVTAATPGVTATPAPAARPVNLAVIIGVFVILVIGVGLYLRSRKKK